MEQQAEKMHFQEDRVSPWSKKFFKRKSLLKCNFCSETFAYTHLWISHVNEAHPEKLSNGKLLRSAVWAFASPCAENEQEVKAKVEQEVHEEVKEPTMKCNTNLNLKETTETIPVEPEPAKVRLVPEQARVKNKKQKRKRKSRGDYINVYSRVRKVKPKSNVKPCQHCGWMKPEHLIEAHCRRNKCPECGKFYKCLGLFSQHRCEARNNETDDSACDVSINIEVKF